MLTLQFPSGLVEVKPGVSINFIWMICCSAEPQNGDGYLRMFDLKGNLIHAFESDCGNGEKPSFKVSPSFVADTTLAIYAFSLYPRLVTRVTELSVVSNKNGDMTVQITVDGKVLERNEYPGIKIGSYSYNLGNLPY